MDALLGAADLAAIVFGFFAILVTAASLFMMATNWVERRPRVKELIYEAVGLVIALFLGLAALGLSHFLWQAASAGYR